jgi:hypothetical protein
MEKEKEALEFIRRHREMEEQMINAKASPEVMAEFYGRAAEEALKEAKNSICRASVEDQIEAFVKKISELIETEQVCPPCFIASFISIICASACIFPEGEEVINTTADCMKFAYASMKRRHDEGQL